MSSSDLASRTVLVVEDDEVLRKLVRQGLEAAGYHVADAADGSLGLAEFKRLTRVGMLLTDVRMPNMDGLELAHEVTGLDGQLPVLFMSGSHLEADLGHGCIRKPFHLADLVARVQRILPVNIAQTA